MRPIYSIHAGEYLVGSYLEQKYRNINVWIPSKDSGIDLLITDKSNKNAVSLQVKYSKDFLMSHMEDIFHRGLKSCGWWNLDKDKIKKSKADYWVLVLHSLNQKNLQYIIIKPKELLSKLTALHGSKKNLQVYLWVTQRDKCWETRDLKKEEQILVANHAYKNKIRDFTAYLNRWDQIIKKANKQAGHFKIAQEKSSGTKN